MVPTRNWKPSLEVKGKEYRQKRSQVSQRKATTQSKKYRLESLEEKQERQQREALPQAV